MLYLERRTAMNTIDFDTFLVALYTIVDDLYKCYVAPRKPRRPGKQPEVSDSEILTLVILAQWLKAMERELLRYAQQHWRTYFPRLLDQSAYNRRARDLAGVFVYLVPKVAVALGAYFAPYQVFDLVPLPLLHRCRGVQHRLFANEADIGCGGSDHDWFYGCQLLVATTDKGLITGFMLGPASTEGHWLAEAFLCWRDDPTAQPWGADDPPPSHRRGGKYAGPHGPLWPPPAAGMRSEVPYVVDDGFYGHFWFEHWRRDYGALVITAQSYKGKGAAEAQRRHRRWRHVIETVNDSLENAFALAFPGAKTLWGVLTRVAAKLLALNLGIWLNRLFGRPDFAFATLFTS